jgi:hypothetical protein
VQIVTFIEDNNLDNIWENLGSVSVMTKLKQYCIVKSKTEDVQYLHLFWIFLYWLNHRRLRNSFVLGYYSFGLILVTIFEIPPNLSTTVISMLKLPTHSGFHDLFLKSTYMFLIKTLQRTSTFGSHFYYIKPQFCANCYFHWR